MFRKIFTTFVVLLCCFNCRLQGNDFYSEYWQEFFWKMWQRDAFALGTYIKIDTGNHFKNIRSLQFNEQLSWKATKDVTLELHYAYLHGRSVVPQSPWRWQHRLELEANRIFHLSCNYLIRTRNRLEIRRIEDEPGIRYRLRQRTMLVIPIQGQCRLKSFSVYNELFYNVSTGQFNQDRLCPLQFTFALTDTMDMDLFFLIRFFNREHAWRKSAVFGTQFIF